MTNDLIMIKHHFDNPITVYPIADVHYGALEHCEREWAEFCRMVQNDSNAYLLLNGDLCNNSVRNSVANPFDEVCRPREQKKRMVEYLTPLKERILAVTSGNHEYRTMRDVDQDITYDICSKLDIEPVYRENVAFIKLAFGNRAERDGTPEVSYMLAMTHGAGGGMLTGGSVNRAERYANSISGIDCLIVGHTHKGFITKPSQIVVDPRNENIVIKPFVVVSCESWLSYGGYAARKMLAPSEIGNPQKLCFSGERKKKSIEVVW